MSRGTGRRQQGAPTIDHLSLGAGSSILIYPGWGLVPHLYREAAAILARHGYRVVIPDLTRTPVPWSPAAAVARSVALLEGDGAGPAAVVGHSLGGALAVLTATTYPRMCRCLVLVDAIGIPPARSSFLRWTLPFTRYVSVQGGRAAAHFLRVGLGGGALSLASAALWATRADLRPLLPRLRNLGIPTYVIWGKGETLLPVDMAREMARLAGGRLLLVPGDHDWNLKKPGLFASVLLTALEHCGNGASGPPRAAGKPPKGGKGQPTPRNRRGQ